MHRSSAMCLRSSWSPIEHTISESAWTSGGRREAGGLGGSPGSAGWGVFFRGCKRARQNWAQRIRRVFGLVQERQSYSPSRMNNNNNKKAMSYSPCKETALL